MLKDEATGYMDIIIDEKPGLMSIELQRLKVPRWRRYSAK